MTQVPAAARLLAQQILSHEASGSVELDVLRQAIERVEMRIRSHLSELIGLSGYAALIARALRLAQAEVPALEHVTINIEKGGLSGIHDFMEVAEADVEDPRPAWAGLTAILAHVIGLLSTFIGEDLALRLVREGWPDLDHVQIALEG